MDYNLLWSLTNASQESILISYSLELAV